MRDPVSLLRSIFVAAMLLEFAPATALDPVHKLSQYGHTAWRVQDGALAGIPYVFAQTTDGYLWVGTSDGLLRFDGVRLVPVTPSPALEHTAIYALMADPKGGLWIGSSNGLAYWVNGDFKLFEETRGRVNAIARDNRGAVWAARTRQANGGPLCRVEDDKARCFGSEEGLRCPYAWTLAISADDDVWIGSSNGLCRAHGGAFDFYLGNLFQRAEGVSGITAVSAGRELLLGSAHNDSEFGVRRFVDGRAEAIRADGLDSNMPVTALFTDRSDALWIGTSNRGLERLQGNRVERMLTADGLSGDSINNFFEDREGSLWIATTRGMDRLRDTHVANVSTREGLMADAVGSVLASRDGAIWIGNEGGVDLIRDGAVSHFTRANGLPGGDVTALFEDLSGRIWMGVDDGVVIYENGKFRRVNTFDGEAVGLVTRFAEDARRTMWAITTLKGLARFDDDRLVERVQPPEHIATIASDPVDGLWAGSANGIFRYRGQRFEPVPLGDRNAIRTVADIHVEEDGIWAATRGGLLRIKNGKPHLVTGDQGLPCNRFLGIIDDERGSFWLTSRCGLIRVSKSDLEAIAEGSGSALSARVFNATDGALMGLPDFHPRAAKGTDGRLWFATGSGAAVLDPDHLNDNTAIPPVRIERIVVDHKDYPITDRLVVPPRGRDIEIDYTALSMVVPERVQFRYRLEGYDEAFQDAGSRRQAFFTGLRPGEYRFHVVASNNDGVWNEIGDTLRFTVAPAWYQTKWFLAGTLAALLMLVWAFHRLRLRGLARTLNVRFEERLSERTRIARELHDTLLQGVHGLLLNVHVAKEKIAGDHESKQLLERTLETADRIIIEGRNRVSSLRVEHITDEELPAAIQSVGRELASSRSVSFRTDRIGRNEALLPQVADEVYYIAREALANAFRHSGASAIEVTLNYGKRSFTLTCRDNGKGFDTNAQKAAGHWGLTGMDERVRRIGGGFACVSRPDGGTCINAEIPSHRAYRKRSGLAAWSRAFRRGT
ncbi:MAG: two-component regulator propeller domain-containing protein [Rhodanobacteraceae bacterium]